MNKYIVLLRAINVSGKNIIKMADLKEKLQLVGFVNVHTYIQSGNILLESENNSSEIMKQINSLIKDEFSLDIDIFVLTKHELRESLEQNPFSKDLPGNRVFITFLDKELHSTQVEEFKKLNLSPEEYLINKKCFYFYLPEGMANSKLNNNFIEKKFNVKSTGRNINTINKMLDLSS